MQGYYGDDMDEYEDDGFIEHDEEPGEYEEDGEDEEEEEVRKPTKEEMDYLALRQKLKEEARKKFKKENGVATGISQVNKKLPNDKFGSFFGPSQPVIAQRVIQESKSLLENQHLAARVSNSHHNSKKTPASATTTSKPSVRDRPAKVVNVAKQKAQKLKDSRDYSFLFSDEPQLPAPSKEPPPRNVPVPNSDARSAHATSKNLKSVSSSSRPVLNGREQRTHVSMGHQMQRKTGQYKVDPGSRPNSTSANVRKQLGSSAANGPGRPVGTKGLSSKMPVSTKTPILNRTSIPNKVPASTVDRKAPVVGVKRPVLGVHRASLPKSHSSVPGMQKAPLPKSHSTRPGTRIAPVSKSHSSEQRREIREPDRGRPMSKQSASSSRPQIKPPKQNPNRAPMQNDRPKKRPARAFDDEDEDEGLRAISAIRSMFRYDPNKYVGVDEDDSDMEANFDDIMKEEKYSAKKAKEEDDRELLLIEEEERRERMRKEAKRRKLSQR